MGFVKIVVGLLLVLLSLGSYSAKLEYYSVIKIKNTATLNLRAWPSTKSKIIARLSPFTKNILFLGKRKTVAKDVWMKVRWNKNEGWVNSRYLKGAAFNENTAKKKATANKLATPKKPPLDIQENMQLNTQKNKSSKSKQKTAPNSTIKKPIPSNRNKQSIKKQGEKLRKEPLPNGIEPSGGRYIQPSDTPPAAIKTQLKQSYAVKIQHQSRLSCRGLKSNKWRINMNMAKKRMWVHVAEKGSYSLPITYSQWNRNSRKRMIVVAGKGRKRVKATLNRNRLCRRKHSRARYTYSINATVHPSQLLSGCCSDMSR